MDVGEIIDVFLKAENIFIAGHEGPEADAMGSSLALGLSLKQLKKNVWIYNKDRVPRNLLFLPKVDEVRNELPNFIPDVFCVVDCSQISRIGKNAEEFSRKAKFIVNIDHHITNDRFGHFNLVVPDSASTSIIIWKIIKKMGIEITPEISTLVYAGIVKDTGGFTFSNTNAEAHEVSAELIRYGADVERVCQSIRWTSISRLKIMKEFISNLQLRNGFAISYLTLDSFRTCSATYEDIEDFVDIIRNLEGVEASVFLRETNDGMWKVSMRSQRLDISGVARRFGGGGHINAAGFKVSGKIDDIIEKIIDELKKVKKE